MSSRPITEDDLNGFTDRTLDPARHAEVISWLDAHPDVAQRVALYGEQADMLRAAFAPVIDEPVPTELDLSRMIEERRRPRQTPRWAMAAAAVLLLSVGAGGGWSLRGMAPPTSEGVQAIAREAAASYVTYAPDQVRPVEIRASDRDVLAAWTAKRVGRPIGIPDLTAAGYRLMGGRVVPTEHGPAALFMYDDDSGARLVMLARPMKTEPDMPMSPHSQGDLNGFAWADNGLGYSLVGGVASDRLHPLANEVRRQIRSEA
ncbi:anti-sigma factor [Ancylobacter sp. TS-1]|uniref:anti-sigma factor family protein n=1 Tax=Ancylobacter sp. TS-1 TaxID=1850374 RepID=UPI001265B7BD|nr:anti-sigma factor [Ancylobacter sp. TS-1]QFR32359.1 anti-sigma factor [Ancylobacter sp. TS-1]